jgi:hypothetical protein
MRDIPQYCVPGAAQHEVVRCRPGIVTVRGDPGSAVHRSALHRIRDTRLELTQ